MDKLKKIIVSLVLILLLTFTACEIIMPMNTPMPEIAVTPLGTTAKDVTILTPEVTSVSISEPAAATVLTTDTPETEVTADISSLPQLSPTLIEISTYMAGLYFKGGDGFHDAVDLTYISSSTYLAAQAGNTYLPENLYDFDLNTVWCEGRSNYGIGEWVLYRVKAFDYAPSAVITKLEIINGYIKTDDLFEDNSMAKQILVTVDYVPVCILNLEKSKMIQQFDIPDIYLSTTDSTAIQFTILDVYEGEVYKDTCITAIEFYGIGIY